MASKTILILAGRRIDRVNADKARFPLSNIHLVKQALEKFFRDHQIGELVSSGACGADLLAQQVASDCKVRRTIILPFDRETFRQTSVADRPGDWGELYDSLLENCSLQILDYKKDDRQAYSKVTDAIVSSGIHTEKKLALCLWDSVKKNHDDASAEFKTKAASAGYEVFEINTLAGA